MVSLLCVSTRAVTFWGGFVSLVASLLAGLLWTHYIWKLCHRHVNYLPFCLQQSTRQIRFWFWLRGRCSSTSSAASTTLPACLCFNLKTWAPIRFSFWVEFLHHSTFHIKPCALLPPQGNFFTLNSSLPISSHLFPSLSMSSSPFMPSGSRRRRRFRRSRSCNAWRWLELQGSTTTSTCLLQHFSHSNSVWICFV